MSNFATRILFVVIAVPLLFATALYVPFMNHLPIALLSLLFTIGSAIEIQRMIEPGAARTRTAVAAFLGALPSSATFVARLAWPGASLAVSWLAPVSISALVAFLVVSVPIALPPKTGSSIAESIRKASANALYLFYPGILGSAIIAILGAPDGAGLMLVWFALLVFGNDSLAWLAGVTLGRRRGIFAVSPNKSLEGLIAGCAGSIGFAFAGPFLFPSVVPRNWAVLAILGATCGAAVVIGDLFESALKRAAGVKDSGSIVPGRGGILDSFDSLLFAAPVFTGILAITGILA